MTTKDPTKAIFSQTTLRNLGDRSYEKRKQAALDIEQIVRQLSTQDGSGQYILNVINVLVQDYAYSPQPNHRKGGLIGLSAIAIALVHNSSPYLELLLPPVLKCFIDPESRVRYYACEALYNISKVARSHVLLYFNEIFDGLCKLYVDYDVDVRSGAQLLDRLVKDIVSECQTFNLAHFIPLLRERIRIKHPIIRQFIVSWISLLDTLPNVDMVEYIPEFLGGLLAMLADPNKDIRQQTYAVLNELLQQLIQTPSINYGSMILSLIHHSSTPDAFSRLTVVHWLFEFIRLGKEKLLPWLASLVSAILACISDAEREVRLKSLKCNDMLLRLVTLTEEDIDVKSVLDQVIIHVSSQQSLTRLSSLKWISLILRKYYTVFFSYLDSLFPSLLRILHDSDHHVLKLNLEVVSLLAVSPAGEVEFVNLELLLVNLLTMFASDVKFLELRGSLIIRHLALYLTPEVIFLMISRLLLDNSDHEFTTLMVQTLHLILLSSPELQYFRQMLIHNIPSQSKLNLFEALYPTWCYSPVSTLSLALLTQNYELASLIALFISRTELTIGAVVQLDRLVQLLESPIYTQLRLHLLHPQTHPYLVQTLYSLLLILPQSSAFTTLQTRLSSIAPLFSQSTVQSDLSTLIDQHVHQSIINATHTAATGSSSDNEAAGGDVVATRDSKGKQSSAPVLSSPPAATTSANPPPLSSKSTTELLQMFLSVQSTIQISQVRRAQTALISPNQGLLAHFSTISATGGSSSTLSASSSPVAPNKPLPTLQSQPLSLPPHASELSLTPGSSLSSRVSQSQSSKKDSSKKSKSQQPTK